MEYTELGVFALDNLSLVQDEVTPLHRRGFL